MTRMIVLILLLGAVADLTGLRAAPNVVRVALRKEFSPQGGLQGQPVMSYFVRTEIGTKPKPFNLLVDVNAREVWVPHYSRVGIVYTRLNYRNGYRKADSTTGIKEPGEVYKINYVGSEFEGKAYRDQIILKDIVESSQPVKFEQRFLAIASASNDHFTQFKSVDGVMALNPWPLSETGSDLPVVAMNRANLTGRELVFGLELDANSDSTHGGELTIGGVNTLKVGGQLKYHQLVSQHQWEVRLQNVLLGANSIDACSTTNSNQSTCGVAVSTIHSDIFGPTEAIRSMLRLLTEDNAKYDVDKDWKYDLVDVDCLKVATAPTLTFVMDGLYYTLPPTSYIRKKVDGLIFKSSTCYFALRPNFLDNKWELGTNFLSNYYTVFDMTKRAIAFSKRM